MIGHRSACRARSAIAVGLALWLAPGPGLAIHALAQEGQGVIRGFLLREDGIKKIGGGKVIAIDTRTGRHYESNMTGENGAYEITGLPAGKYDIVMEATGVFVINDLVDLAEGQHLALSLSRQVGTAPDRRIAGLEIPKGTAVPTTVRETASATTAGSGGFWKRTPGVVLLAVLGAGAIAAIANAAGGGDGNPSPSTP